MLTAEALSLQVRVRAEQRGSREELMGAWFGHEQQRGDWDQSRWWVDVI